MRRAEELEARVGELQGELRELLDEYVEVQQRIQTLETATGREGDRAAETVVADLPARLRRVARAGGSTGTDDIDDAERDAAGDSASQAEVAAAVERVEESAPTDEAEASDGATPATDDRSTGDGESTPAGNDEEDLDDIIVG
jgi:hypothetical protein